MRRKAAEALCIIVTITSLIRLERAVVFVLGNQGKKKASFPQLLLFQPGACRPGHNFLQGLISLCAQASVPALLLRSSLHGLGQDANPVVSPAATPWVFAWGCMAQASGIGPLMSSSLYDVAVAAFALMLVRKVRLRSTRAINFTRVPV